MPQDPFPEPGPDSQEPAGSPLPPAADRSGSESDWDGRSEGPGQGLYVCLPPEQVTLAGFAQNGEADTMSPGPLLATVMHTVTGEDGAGLAGCSDDQLIGIISASQRLASRAAWTEMAAVREYAARHSGTRPADEFAPVELGYELHLTAQSAAEQMQYALAVADRLPATFAALAAGQIHPVHLRIIEDETRFLNDQDAAKADAALSRQAPGLTFGEVRYSAHKLILRLDPDAARKRKEAARGEAHVRRFRENSGNAGMVARELPSDEVLASWQHVEQRALDLRAAGMAGSLQDLRVRAYLDLLQERDSRDQSAGPVRADGGEVGQAGLSDQAPSDDGPGSDDPGPCDPGPGGSGPEGNGGPGGPSPRPGRPAPGPSLGALVTISIPWATWQGRSETAGEADGFGLLDGDDARDLVAAAGRHRVTRWCLTVLNPDGTAAAHGCLSGRHPPGAGPPGPHHLTMTPVARGPCDHAHAEVGYHPSRKLAHLIRAAAAHVPRPAATVLPSAVTWTIPSHGIRAGSPANVISLRSASDNDTGCLSIARGRVTVAHCRSGGTICSHEA